MLAKVIIENGVKKIQALTADTGTGAPVGSVIVVCSNILPSGYLGLGVQYDITNYPALYQVLGTDTTPTASALGLPTLSSGQYAIKATSGLTENQQENVLNTINENNSYSTTEHKTGKKWIDGKDIYSLVIPINNQVSVLNNYDLTDKNIEWVTKSDVMIYNDNKQHIETNLIDYNISTKKLVATSQLWCSYANIEYTKTTD